MVHAFNAAVDAKVDGIAVSIIDQLAFNDPVERSLKSGIPVVAYNADAPAASGNKRLAYIGQDLFNSGLRLGTHVYANVEPGLVGVFIATPGTLNLQPRADGLQTALSRNSQNWRIHTIATTTDPNQAKNEIRNFIFQNPRPSALISVDGGSTQALGTVIRDFNLVDQGIYSAGYDLLPRTIELLKSGFLNGIVDQQPYLQGYLSVTILALCCASGGILGVSDIDTGYQFLQKNSTKVTHLRQSRFIGNSDKRSNIDRIGSLLD